MSVINRMLADLERRGAPTPRAGDQEMRPSAPARRRPAVSPGAGLAVLALVLLLLAAALWFQRGERIVAMLQPAGEPVPAVPTLVGLSFDPTEEGHRLAIRVSDAISREPRYSRSGGTATLVLDAVGGDITLPAPPPGQALFRGLSLDSGDARKSRLQLDVAPDAELRLRVDGSVVTLSGRMPEAEPNPAAEAATATVSSAGEDETRVAGTSADPEAAADASPAADETRTSSTGAATGASAGTEAAAQESPASGENAATPAAASSPDGPAAVRESPPDSANMAAAADPRESADGDQPAADDPGAQAEGQVRKSASLSPATQARRRYREGRDAIAGGELAGARRALMQALELDPSLHAARELLVGLLRRAGEGAAARRLLAEGVERAPGRLPFAMPYARMLVDTGDLDRAAQVLERARASGTGSASYHALLAAVQQRRGLHHDAASEYTRALESRPGNGHWWLGLGVSLVALDKPAEARAAFREARTSGTLSESLDRWARQRIDELGKASEG